MHIRLKQAPTAYKWLFIAGMFLVLFVVYTAIFSSGVLLLSTLRQEQWLLHRPITRADCVIAQWKVFGEAPVSVLLTLVLGVVCLWLGYRRCVLPYLVFLLLLGIGVEYAGKHYFPQAVPTFLQRGMDGLGCPQIASQPRSVKLMVMLGMWWEAPALPIKRLQRIRHAQTASLTTGGRYDDYSYPSGHAIRWIFIGLIACWLLWRQMKYRRLRWLLMALTLAMAISGGFAQFYTGFHLASDLTGGYLFGASIACCAIGLLLLNERHNTLSVAHPGN